MYAIFVCIFFLVETDAVWLVGGPDRPIPEPEPQPGTKAVAGSSSGAAASGAAGYAATAASIQDNLYNRLTSAFSERGYVVFAIHGVLG